MAKKKTKNAGKPANRYARRSKLSEYRFLRILEGFTMDKTAQELAESIGISEKSIRATYRDLRLALMEAALSNTKAFGGAGFYLLRHENMGPRRRRFLDGVAQSELYARHVKRHAPRLKSSNDKEALTFEVAMRMFCNIDIDDGSLINYPPETKQALLTLRDIAQWIKDNLRREGFMEHYGHVVEEFFRVSKKMDRLTEEEELLALRSKSRPHRYPWMLMYNDLRKYLLKHPL
jgi:hypothetical protein